MMNPFDWNYLTQVPKSLEAYGPLAIAYVVLFALGLIGALLLGRALDRRFRDHALHRRLARQATRIAAWVFAAGLVFFGFRALELPFLGMRLWLYLCVLAVAVMVVLGAWYWRVRYPAELARYQQEQTRRQYLRPGAPPRARGEGQRARGQRSGAKGQGSRTRR